MVIQNSELENVKGLTENFVKCRENGYNMNNGRLGQNEQKPGRSLDQIRRGLLMLLIRNQIIYLDLTEL